MIYSVSISESINKVLEGHLLGGGLQEYLCFGLYNPSSGKIKFSGLISEVLLPNKEDQNLHGNVSFNSCYFDRVTDRALETQSGIVFIHSHLGPGWQGMSKDDETVEEMLASRAFAISGLPILGMTIGNDGYWSARFWIKTGRGKYKREWCQSIKVMGESFKIYYNDRLAIPPSFGVEFTRTISSWGEKKQNDIARLRVGVVGLGSVGSLIAESLMRTGITNITLIDFDTIEDKNLDRLIYASRDDVGRMKVEFYKEMLIKNSPLKMNLQAIPYAIMEEEGYKHALDCDILFSCVDKPWARFTLDCISYAHMIPVIDGGIDAGLNARRDNIGHARWKSILVGPERMCLSCFGQYTRQDVALEQSGLLDDPKYIKNLPEGHFIRRGENVFSYSIGLASMEMHQFLSFILRPKGVFYGPKEYDFVTGTIDSDFDFRCREDCDIEDLLTKGNAISKMIVAKHPVAEKKRIEATPMNQSLIQKMRSWIKK